MNIHSIALVEPDGTLIHKIFDNEKDILHWWIFYNFEKELVEYYPTAFLLGEKMCIANFINDLRLRKVNISWRMMTISARGVVTDG